MESLSTAVFFLHLLKYFSCLVFIKCPRRCPIDTLVLVFWLLWFLLLGVVSTAFVLPGTHGRIQVWILSWVIDLFTFAWVWFWSLSDDTEVLLRCNGRVIVAEHCNFIGCQLFVRVLLLLNVFFVEVLRLEAFDALTVLRWRAITHVEYLTPVKDMIWHLTNLFL